VNRQYNKEIKIISCDCGYMFEKYTGIKLDFKEQAMKVWGDFFWLRLVTTVMCLRVH
jgi:hypothetical protein